MSEDRSDVVAIVDDDRGFRDAAKLLLEIFGHKVATFASAEAFLADREPHPACLVCDQHLQRMTGLELAAQLLRDGAKIPFLLMIGAPSPSISSMAAQLGIWGVLVKPFDEDDLLEFIELHV
jgi:two-component system, LuxR family, response regulator FixJ